MYNWFGMEECHGTKQKKITTRTGARRLHETFDARTAHRQRSGSSSSSRGGDGQTSDDLPWIRELNDGYYSLAACSLGCTFGIQCVYSILVRLYTHTRPQLHVVRILQRARRRFERSRDRWGQCQDFGGHRSVCGRISPREHYTHRRHTHASFANNSRPLVLFRSIVTKQRAATPERADGCRPLAGVSRTSSCVIYINGGGGVHTHTRNIYRVCASVCAKLPQPPPRKPPHFCAKSSSLSTGGRGGASGASSSSIRPSRISCVEFVRSFLWQQILVSSSSNTHTRTSTWIYYQAVIYSGSCSSCTRPATSRRIHRSRIIGNRFRSNSLAQHENEKSPSAHASSRARSPAHARTHVYLVDAWRTTTTSRRRQRRSPSVELSPSPLTPGISGATSCIRDDNDDSFRLICSYISCARATVQHTDILSQCDISRTQKRRGIDKRAETWLYNIYVRVMRTRHREGRATESHLREIGASRTAQRESHAEAERCISAAAVYMARAHRSYICSLHVMYVSALEICLPKAWKSNGQMERKKRIRKRRSDSSNNDTSAASERRDNLFINSTRTKTTKCVESYDGDDTVRELRIERQQRRRRAADITELVRINKLTSDQLALGQRNRIMRVSRCDDARAAEEPAAWREENFRGFCVPSPKSTQRCTSSYTSDRERENDFIARAAYSLLSFLARARDD
ncbi:unnamed protein product [Trichogramma brassicae]|uniref:Uncharacterized protein n=1 Tax=Trichogramma brassicae TaxID=86971 RepID=A0A6H5I4A9_9HYME|nr:unnamed protein product [Trichogramma brassicae]